MEEFKAKLEKLEFMRSAKVKLWFDDVEHNDGKMVSLGTNRTSDRNRRKSFTQFEWWRNDQQGIGAGSIRIWLHHSNFFQSPCDLRGCIDFQLAMLFGLLLDQRILPRN